MHSPMIFHPKDEPHVEPHVECWALDITLEQPPNGYPTKNLTAILFVINPSNSQVPQHDSTSHHLILA